MPCHPSLMWEIFRQAAHADYEERVRTGEIERFPPELEKIIYECVDKFYDEMKKKET